MRGLDCEMVGVGPRGKRSILIRVSVVSRRGKARPRPSGAALQVLLDCLTEPEEDGGA